MGRRWYRRSFPKSMYWRKLVVIMAFCTAILTLLLTCSVPYPLSDYLMPSPVSSPRSMTSSKDASFSPIVVASPSPVLLPPVVSTQVSFPDNASSNFSSSFLVSSPIESVSADVSVNNVEQSSEKRSRAPDILIVQKQRLMSAMSPNEALAYAKREIDRAPAVDYDDPDLYAPLFRNISVFKRSYELMENILKVYVYRDGAKPIFHTPPIKGIYASEGWFMKLMEKNRKFLAKDPSKAHLFYLPYSAHQLQLALYVPDSHNMQTLSLFLKNYVNTIAAKYPFWNRTHGSDHFFVACHDWGPYITKEHDELLKNSIKALCNADISEGIFVRGRDVSLPETTIAVPRRPSRDIGGKPPSQRTILAFYAGNMHGRVRPVLLKHWGGKDGDMRIYGSLSTQISKKMSYAQHMKSSRFCICPMGYEVNSPRIVEAIYYECVPVIIADNFVLPFDDVLDWSAFSVIVEERDIPILKDILVRISPQEYASKHTNVQRLQKHFLWHAKPVKYDIFHMILHSIWLSRLYHIGIQQQ